MNDTQAQQYWNDNAEAWTELARAGFDIYRDHLNTPAFFNMLPDVRGLSGIDVGCGEGYNTRILATKGARVTAIDISETFIKKAKDAEEEHPLGINYRVARAADLPFENSVFDFATSFMCLMDVARPQEALREINRVLKPSGFLQFSITHPCFTTPHRRNLRNRITGKTYAVEVGDYFKNRDGQIDEWIFGETPPVLRSKFQKFKTPVFNWTLTQWFHLIHEHGFAIEQINEPYASDDVVHAHPGLQDTQVVAYFLHFRCRKC